jgi:hypothetical protein
MAPWILPVSTSSEALRYKKCKKNIAHKEWGRVENLKKYRRKSSVEGIVTETSCYEEIVKFGSKLIVGAQEIASGGLSLEDFFVCFAF